MSQHFDALLISSISEITISKVLRLKGNICNDYTASFIACISSAASAQIPLITLILPPHNVSFQNKGTRLTFFMSLLLMGSSDIL